MSITITIDGKKLIAEEGSTILNVASQNGIKIPNLCYDGRVELYGACGLCTVEIEGNPKLLRACSTKVADGMIVHTQTERVKASRKVALELLLSDHTGDCVAPCSKACPAGTDCQGYVGLIANGEYKEAVKLIKEKLPLPASIGRICPHPCEKQCRRQYVDEPISIAFLKGFVGDMDLIGDTYIPEIEPDTNKKVSVIGGGPAGLTAAYFLRKKGHSVTIFEQMPQMGGMLRYGIPEYRLPKAVLDKEIKLIEDMGVTLKNNVNIGKDISFEEIKNDFDATLVAIGAWNSSKMHVSGEDLDGVWGGIDFLREVSLGNKPEIGKNVAVCGGGNTAMDACRVAVRLGAENVYIIYRRTKDEMPADPQEILESEEEGVIYKYLTNPIEFTGENGKLNGVILQKMMLGDPDESGRRSPVAIEGETETIALDSIIMAIGQYPNLNGFETLEATRRNTISADESRFTTSMDGVFAVGDATNRGADIAIAAIGEAQKASVVIDRYLNGETVGYKKTYFVEQDSKAIDYSRFEKSARAKMPHMTPQDRKTNFKEVNFGFTEEMAKKEANRCLECGCHDYFECKLISYANDYDVNPSRFAGEKHNRNQENANDLIARNTDKCILCGLCVRVCEEVMGKSAIGLINRGFNTYVEPELSKPLKETDCIACGQCVALCPTGALREKTSFTKSVPVKENSKISICTNCSNLCSVDYRYIGSTVTRALPVDNGILCKGGRFSVLNDKTESVVGDISVLENGNFSIIVGGRVSAEVLLVLKKYAVGKNADIFTTAKETDANYYSISKMGIKTYKNLPEDIESVLLVNTDIDTDKKKVSIEFSPYCENGTFFDKYGNKRIQNAIFETEYFSQIINNKNFTVEAEKTVNATPTGKVTNEEIINASKLFK